MPFSSRRHPVKSPEAPLESGTPFVVQTLQWRSCGGVNQVDKEGQGEAAIKSRAFRERESCGRRGVKLT